MTRTIETIRQDLLTAQQQHAAAQEQLRQAEYACHTAAAVEGKLRRELARAEAEERRQA